MIKRYIIIILCLVSYAGHSQQLPQFSQYMNVQQYVNPAITGSEKELIAGILGRHQWIGLKEDKNIYPRTYMLFFETPLQVINSGVGIVGFYDQVGFDKGMYLRLNYAYHMKISSTSILSIGASADYQRQTIDLGDYGFTPLGNELGEMTKGTFDFGLGAYFRSSKGYFAGLSAQNLLQSEIDFGDFKQANSIQYQFIIGSSFKLNDSKKSRFDLLPSLLIKTVAFVPPQYDLNLTVLYNNKFYAGIIYRYEDAIGPIIGLVLKNIKAGISYDYTTSSLRQAGSKGSLEVFVAYRRTIAPLIKWKSLYNTKDL
jgi:type IX secretion system PorP/SprF family membrane protein